MTASIPDRSGEIPRLLEHVLPGEDVQSVVELGQGTDHVAYEVNWELIVRFVADPDPAVRAKQTRSEAGVLAMVAPLAPPLVPEPLFVGPDDGVLIYRKIAGRPLLHLQEEHGRIDLAAFGAVIGGFLSRLHQVPLTAFGDFAPSDQSPLTESLTDARQQYGRVRDSVPAALRPSIERFLANSQPPEPDVAVFCHNDLGIEHILVNPLALTVTGVIDWADAAITDPAGDLGRIYRDLGPDALAAILDHYSGVGEPAESLQQRAEFYARCSVFEEMAYGLLPGNEAYLTQSRSALPRLYAN